MRIPDPAAGMMATVLMMVDAFISFKKAQAVGVKKQALENQGLDASLMNQRFHIPLFQP
jgi:hypothetical protein